MGRPGGEGGGGKPLPPTSEITNGSVIQTISNILSKSSIDLGGNILNGNWIQGLIFDKSGNNMLFNDYGIESTGSYLMDYVYFNWLQAGLNINYQLDEFGEPVFDEFGEPIIISYNEFELINGDCWQSLFIYSGLKDYADDKVALGFTEFADYPYNGSWQFTISKLLLAQG